MLWQWKQFCCAHAVAVLNLRVAGLRPRGAIAPKTAGFVAELDAPDAPRDLRFVMARKGFEAGMRNHVQVHVEVPAFGVFGQPAGSLAVDFRTSTG